LKREVGNLHASMSRFAESQRLSISLTPAVWGECMSWLIITFTLIWCIRLCT